MYSEHIGRDCCLPIDIEGLVELFEQIPLLIESEDTLGYEVLGHYDFVENHIVVSDAITHEGRRRFTIAHEYGHYILHRPHYERHISQPTLGFDEEPTQNLRFIQRAPLGRLSQIEYQANAFASECLMPEELVIKFVRERLGRGDRHEDLPGILAQVAGVSLQAAQIRLNPASPKFS